MNISKTSYSRINAQNAVKTTKKGRFIIEDFSDCIVKDYNEFVNNLKQCDIEQQRLYEDIIQKLLTILELQNRQIKVLKDTINKETTGNTIFNKTCDYVDVLIQDIKNRFNK